jgi:RNA polymerase sigma-70 factor (ECF subfamily)
VDTARLDAEWARHRPAVFGAAYRLLGSVADAEDVTQDVWLRAAQASLDEVVDLRAWLVTVAARRSYDILTSARARRESYVGPWLPEPLLTGPDAAEPVLLDDTVTTAMLLLLEELTPAERVAFVLHHAFELPYERIGQVLGTSAAAGRQLASRARRKLARSPQAAGAAGPAADAAAAPTRSERALILSAFRAAYERGDVAGLVSLLAPDVVYTTDGGGEVRAARKRIVGASRVAAVFAHFAARHGLFDLVPAEINGEPGLLLVRDDEIYSADTFALRDGRITEMRRVLNPAKLSHVRSPGGAAAHAVAGPLM